MQEFRQRMRKKVYRTFLKSFLLVFVLPVVALIGFMTNMLTTVERELETSNRLALEQLKSGPDGQFFSIMRIGDTLVVDDKLLYFSTMPDPMQYLNNLTTFQTLRSLTQEMTTIQVSNASIENCYIYFSRSGKVVSNTVMDASDYFLRRLADEFGQKEAWQTFLNTGMNGFVLRGGAETKNRLSYVRTVFRGQSAVAVIVITLGDAMLDRYQALVAEKEGAGFHIFDEQGRLLFSTQGTTSFTLTEEMLEEPEGRATQPTQADNLRLSWSRSTDTRCIYVTSIPEDIYWVQLSTIRQVSILLVLAILGVGFFLSFALAKRQYRPIHALRSFVEGSREEEEKEAGDDFAYLTEMMQSMKNSRVTTQQRLKFSNRNMEHFVLESLMWGTYAAIHEVEEQLLALDIAFDSDDFLVVGFAIDGFF